MRNKDRETLKNKKERSMRRYGGGPGKAQLGRLSREFLEADDDDADDDDGLTYRGRSSLGSQGRDYRDEEEELKAERRILSAKKDQPSGRSSGKRKKQYSSEEDSEEEEDVQ